MSEVVDCFYFDKSRPFSAALAALGMARLADALLLQQAGEQRRVTIRQEGSCYLVQLSPALDLSFPHRIPLDLVQLIETEKNSDALPAGSEQQRWNYKEYKDRVSQYFELRRSMSPRELNNTGALDDNPQLKRLEQLKPDATWHGMAMINQMQALTAYNEVVATWLACAAHGPALLRLIVQLWGSPPDEQRRNATLEAWRKLAKTQQLSGKETVTASQTVNPEQGKGANRSKADGLTVGNQDNFWLEELLKFAGIFVAAIPRTVSGVKDRKTYVLLPRDIDFQTHRALYHKFHERLWPSTAVKMDILAALEYCKLFVDQFASAQTGVFGLSYRPDNHIQGMATAFYKDLGSAVATMNLATVNLPAWAGQLEGRDGALELFDLFEEQIRIIRNLDEGKGEEETLLQTYRDFLSSRDPRLTAFFEFTNHYAAYVMSKMVRRQPVARLSTRSLEIIVMSNDQQRRKQKPLGPIINNPGFQNIAEAIRRSTVVPQYQKNQGTTTYEVRYGLGDKLKRKASYPLQFIQELSDFMHLYNQENARIAEKRQMQFRKSITIEDINQVAALLDEYGDDAPAVAYLLIAYGYARDSKERDSKQTPNDGEDTPNETDDNPDLSNDDGE